MICAPSKVIEVRRQPRETSLGEMTGGILVDDNPYRAPLFSETPDVAGESRSESEIRAFVGRNAGYYLRKWPVDPNDHGSARGFNWAAFLLSGIWLPYRKMYRVSLIFFSIIVVTSVIAEIAAYAGVAGESAINAWDRFGGIIFSLVCGFFANSWYLAHTKREIAEVRAMGLSDTAYFDALARRGGTNLLAALGFFVLFVAVMFLAMAILGAVIETSPIGPE